jgi:hypothetical protein
MQSTPIKLSILVLVSILFYHSAKAQTNDFGGPELRSQNVYLEAFGPGLTYSINYDSRFINTADGLGGRIGLGYFHQGGDYLFSAPIALNYLIGRNGRFLELGVGITYYDTDTDYPFVYNSSRIDKSNVIGTFDFGYRLQPEGGGFSFRVGISPVLTSKTFAPYWPYISFGYAF